MPRLPSCLFLALGCLDLLAAPTNTVLELNQRAWFYGRNYFVLRSGAAQMVLQWDRADLGPGLTYLLFDAGNARQSSTKQGALNWDKETGVEESALQVILGKFPFTALGHRTQARWKEGPDGVPAVKVTWWAGGIRVTESISAASDDGVFLREIELAGAHIVAPQAVSLRLCLPGQVPEPAPGIALVSVAGANLALAASGPSPRRSSSATGALEVSPLTVAPGQNVRITSWIGVQIPAGDPRVLIEKLHAHLSGSDEAMVQAAARWRSQSRIETRDSVVQGIYDRARFQLAGMIAQDGTMDAGIFEYGAQWVRDTSNTALGLVHAGQFEAARAALVRMLTRMISPEGVTMIANVFEKPDLEQFDQMGELLHVLKAYRDWTGDDSLIRQHRELLLALIERPLRPEFRDSTGMVHNRREFWERTFSDGYEIAYQTYVILGLREAADLADSLGAADRAPRWRAEAERMLAAVLRHPSMSLVKDGHLIKRRNLDGHIADDPGAFKGFAPDVPLSTESAHRLMPDASMSLPLALGIIEPGSRVSLRTLDYLEALWNTRWSDGGYDRYHTSSQPDQPGPWPFATTFILRAQHNAGLWDRSRRSLEWLNSCAGGETGAWFEEISSVRSQERSCGLVQWTSAEVTLFTVRHYLGVSFQGDKLLIRPKPYPGSPPINADLRFRSGRLRFQVTSKGRVTGAQFNGRAVKVSRDGRVALPIN